MILLRILFTDFCPLLQAVIISYLIDILQRFLIVALRSSGVIFVGARFIAPQRWRGQARGRDKSGPYYELFHGMWDIVLQNVLHYSG